MTYSLRNRLAARRRQAFVGRAAELELLGSALAAEEPPFTVLYVHGAGGVGKSALVRMFAALGEDAGQIVARVDGHDVEPNPQALQAAVADASPGGPGLLVVDSYELLAPLDEWLREELLPGLPAGVLVVIASRQLPAPGWRADPGWRDLLRLVRLGNLPDEDALAYLAGAGLPGELGAEALQLTGGHPLAMTLVADLVAQRGPGALRQAMGDPDVLTVLVSQVLDGAPDQVHRQALEACALVRVTTEPLLRAVLGAQDAHELFGWLRGLSCIEVGPRGLYPHDLAREVLEADLRWRDDTGHRGLRDRIMADVFGRVRAERDQRQLEAIYDLFFQLRFDPVQRRYWQWETLGAAVPEPVRPADREAALALVAAHEGPESAAIAARWLDRQPDGFTLYRTRGELGGVIGLLSLDLAAREDVQADPVTAAAWGHAAAHGPVGPGDEIIIVRFQIDRDAYQRPSQLINLVSVGHVQRIAAHPQVTWSFLVTADPDFWVPHYAEIGFRRLVDVVVGSRRFSVFAHDFRQPHWRWDPLRPSLRQPVPMSPPRPFQDAVKQALRDLGRDDLLGRNPLLDLRLVREAGDGPAALRATLIDAAGVLHGHPRDERLFRAVDRTYLRPAPTQERAAELLGLPFSTYRRHLAQGVARIAARLWEREEQVRN
ncbi:MAG TPA: ATP-binding protein [Streptosporangiaceae bacterium]|nr:ATP-binding protein [Streptosporangiaceae bacterium]